MIDQEPSPSRKRIQHITTLNTRTVNLDQKRVKECKEAIWNSYEAASIVPQLAHIIRERKIEITGFQSIGLLYRIKMSEFNASNYYWGPYFSDVGRAIASGEQKYLQEQIQKEIEPFTQTILRSSPDFSFLIKHIESLLKNSISPNVILAPIELYTEFIKTLLNYLDWKSGHIEQLVLGSDARLKVFWSNKYAPLNSFLIFNSNSVEWHCIPDQNTDRLITIALGQSEEHPDSVEYWAETLVKYEITQPQAFSVINLSGEPRESNMNT